MKSLFARAFELLGFIFLGVFAGRHADAAFGWEGWGTLLGAFAAYALWLPLFLKTPSSPKGESEESPKRPPEI